MLGIASGVMIITCEVGMYSINPLTYLMERETLILNMYKVINAMSHLDFQTVFDINGHILLVVS